MVWFFAVLVVLALGGVALVASGSAGTLPKAYGDRRDVTLPADRPVTAEDLRRVSFNTAVRGYRMDEVDALLDRLVRELDEQRGGEHSG